MRVRCLSVVAPLALASVIVGGCGPDSESASRHSATDLAQSPSVSARGDEATLNGPPGYRTTEIETAKTGNWAMNNEGQVIGVRGWPDVPDSFLWDPGTGLSDLGRFRGAVAINDVGQVAGVDWDRDVVVGDGDPATFLWDPTSGFQDVGMRPTRDFNFRVGAITDTGRLVGDLSFGAPSEYLDGDRPHSQAAVWDPHRGLVKFGQNGTGAAGVNDKGQVLVVRSRLNEAEDGWVRSTFVWTPWGSTQHVITSEQFSGTGINNRGQVLVSGIDEDFRDEYLLWDPRTEQAQRIPLKYVFVGWSGAPMNDRGQVAGIGPDDQAALWDPQTGVTLIGTVPGATVSEALSINNAGQVVGSSSLVTPLSYNSEGGIDESVTEWTHAFVWDAASGIRDLGQFREHDSQAFKINDRGDILAWSGPELADDTGTLVIWTSEEAPDRQ